MPVSSHLFVNNNYCCYVNDHICSHVLSIHYLPNPVLTSSYLLHQILKINSPVSPPYHLFQMKKESPGKITNLFRELITLRNEMWIRVGLTEPLHWVKGEKIFFQRLSPGNQQGSLPENTASCFVAKGQLGLIGERRKKAKNLRWRVRGKRRKIVFLNWPSYQPSNNKPSPWQQEL